MKTNQLSQNKKPLFTVIMPTYNRAHSLPAAIKSLQQQSLTSWELIVVDDGSVDNTRDIVLTMAKADPRIKLWSQKKSGAITARNNGMSLASGEYLAFLESDDTLTPEHLQLRYDVFLNNRNIEMIYGPANIMGNPYVVDKYNPSRMINLGDESIKMCGTFAIKRTEAIRLGGFSSANSFKDGAFFTKVERSGIKIFRLRVKTYNYGRTISNSLYAN